MRRWSELKEVFWALADGEPEEKARRLGELASTDPELHRELEPLLAADASGELPFQAFKSTPDAPPERIGTYEILGVLGAGGMGEVYRAHDSRLLREVAVKVLPASVSRDPELQLRFEREARLLASLNHPHIAQVYGLEESGGLPVLVMELVEGQTLSQMIAGHPDALITMARALKIARQIADGLDAAHDKGIVHRDLKPGNIALTRDGDVKILDFGVAKNFGAVSADAIGPVATGVHTVIGTPAYMSPEQARGAIVDKRTDIWAFGCVLYELLTGQRAFEGKTASDSIAAVLERSPDMTILPADTPPALRSLVGHCLEKDTKQRLRDIADARLVIDDILKDPTDARDGLERRAVPARSRRRSAGLRVFWGVAAVAVISGSTIGLIRVLPGTQDSSDRAPFVSSLVLPPGLRLSGDDVIARFSEGKFAAAPNGQRVVFVAGEKGGRVRLWLRPRSTQTFMPLPDTEDASYPFWSADSEQVAFIAGGKLKRILLSDGTVTTVAEGGFRTGAWSRDNMILFAPAASSALLLVPCCGGDPTPVTTLDAGSGEVQHSHPAFLPDARHFLYSSRGTKTGGALEPGGVYVGSLDGEEPRLLLKGATQAVYASGRVLFLRGGKLMAQSFDPDRRVLRGDPILLKEKVDVSTTGATGVTASFSVSDNGVLIYQAGLSTTSQLVWFDRDGKRMAPLGPPDDYGDVALSRDETRVAVSKLDPDRSTKDIWVYDVKGGGSKRLTLDPEDEFAPVWSPDNERVLFSSLGKGGGVGLYIQNVIGPSNRQLLPDSFGLGRFAADWSRDLVMYISGGRAIGRSDLWIAPVVGPRPARPLVESVTEETHGRISPDGRWFAYASKESGRFEVYVDRFPALGARRPVSLNGGMWPRWTKKGREIVFLTDTADQLMAATIRDSGDHLEIDERRPLFPIRARPPMRLDAYAYDVSLDGQRFLVNTLIEETASTAITLVLHWDSALPAD